MDESLFSRRVLEALQPAEREERLRQLSVELSKRLEGIRDGAEFFTATREVVEQLKAIGHDLCSFDSDGETFDAWGGDYAHPDRAGKLTLTFTLGQGVRAEWSPGDA